MTNKLVVIINSLKVPKIKKSLLYEMKFLVPIYSCLQNPLLGGYVPRSPFSLFSVLNWICWTPFPKKKNPGYATASGYQTTIPQLSCRLPSHCADTAINYNKLKGPRGRPTDTIWPTHTQNANHRCISHGSLWHCTWSLCTGGKQNLSLDLQRHIKQDRWIYRTSTKCALTIGAIICPPPPPMIINDVTPRSHNNDPEYCLLSKEWNPVRKNSQEILTFCTFYIPPTTAGAARSSGAHLRHWFSQFSTPVAPTSTLSMAKQYWT